MSAVVPPQNCTRATPDCVDVHKNQTSSFAAGQKPVCCVLVVAPAVLTGNVPAPEIALGVEQSSLLGGGGGVLIVNVPEKV